MTRGFWVMGSMVRVKEQLYDLLNLGWAEQYRYIGINCTLGFELEIIPSQLDSSGPKAHWPCRGHRPTLARSLEL